TLEETQRASKAASGLYYIRLFRAKRKLSKIPILLEKGESCLHLAERAATSYSIEQIPAGTARQLHKRQERARQHEI
ncbi:uncharacterized, partial [Tachysurus ichikawai]